MAETEEADCHPKCLSVASRTKVRSSIACAYDSGLCLNELTLTNLICMIVNCNCIDQ